MKPFQTPIIDREQLAATLCQIRDYRDFGFENLYAFISILFDNLSNLPPYRRINHCVGAVSKYSNKSNNIEYEKIRELLYVFDETDFISRIVSTGDCSINTMAFSNVLVNIINKVFKHFYGSNNFSLEDNYNIDLIYVGLRSAILIDKYCFAAYIDLRFLNILRNDIKAVQLWDKVRLQHYNSLKRQTVFCGRKDLDLDYKTELLDVYSQIAKYLDNPESS